MRPIFLIVFAAAALLAVAALAGVGRPEPAAGDTTTTQNAVTTVGHGTVTAVPDQATVSAGVRTTAVTAAGALSTNAAAMNKVVAALRSAGGEKLQTQEVSLYPQTDQRGAVTGYVAQDTVSAKTEIAVAGRLVDAAVEAGANTVNGPSLDVSDTDTLYRLALAKALDDARAKAQALAEAGGFGVGPVLSVTEQSNETPIVFAAAGPKAAGSTPVEAGTQDVTAKVQVSFQIR